MVSHLSKLTKTEDRTMTIIETNVATPIQNLVDRAEIADLVHRLGVCLDEADFDGLRAVLVDDATLRSPGGSVQGIDAIVAQAARIHPPQDGILHSITNVLIDLIGNTATARANLIVSFATPADTDEPGQPPMVRSIQGQVYQFAFVRLDGGWRFSSIETSLVWKSGDPVTVAARRSTSA
jgi:SnoaL-like domain